MFKCVVKNSFYVPERWLGNLIFSLQLNEEERVDVWFLDGILECTRKFGLAPCQHVAMTNEAFSDAAHRMGTRYILVLYRPKNLSEWCLLLGFVISSFH